MEFLMPKMDHLSEEALITEWLKAVGDHVEKGEVLLKVETNKAVLEVESDCSGTLTQILCQAGEEVPVLTPIAVIE